MSDLPRADDCLINAEEKLRTAGIEGPRREARLLLAYHLGCTVERVMAFPEEPVADRQRFDAMIARRAAREPLSHITGLREFWSLDFEVSSHVLDPRPDSETLIEAVLTLSPPADRPLSIVDFGTGSGCLLLTLLSERPLAKGTAVDLSPDALAVAQRNAIRHGLAERCSFIRSNWAENVTGPFDIVISNPPYIESATVLDLEPEVRDHEPHLALDGGADGLVAYRALIPQAFSLLREGGLIALELGMGQAGQVSEILLQSGFSEINTHCDLAGIERCLTARHP
ncbi:peptide chain release factor N(5)-glutamine methyltransferase [Aestuariispira insulae]|uniref:Release factor glutamine methyltransferase n=1 Tax=Aestuariispira insulae TaxID=1461337 RepID=A0A3D9HFN5_9PROT|nr:peptide chain release factor N(5)-glutamine methyltransferase [Aestuariispira insulae]RED48061.1 release factor glutamine methyltransferase [Aestuariispira insulae]